MKRKSSSNGDQIYKENNEASHSRPPRSSPPSTAVVFVVYDIVRVANFVVSVVVVRQSESKKGNLSKFECWKRGMNTVESRSRWLSCTNR